MTGRVRRSLASAVAACAASLTLAPASEGYAVAGQPWPDGTVTYYTQARGYEGAVNRAARILTRAGVGVRVRRVSSRELADVVVVYGGQPCEGEATVGFQRFRVSVLYLGAGCNRGLVTLTAVHEFGHVLGLAHENRRCARMNPSFNDSGTPTLCRRHTLAYWLTHPLTSDDRRGLRAIYG